MSTFVLVGDLVEILDTDNERIHCGTVMYDEIKFDPDTLLDRRYVSISGWHKSVPDSEVRLVLRG